jgi:hypothetical protein
LEKRVVLVYKQNVNQNFIKASVLLSIFLLFFGAGAAHAQEETADKLAVVDQRQIIEVLLKEKFRGSDEKTIYLSTANLPAEIQKDFPLLKNKKVQFISTETAAGREVCAYEFGAFEMIDRFVSVTFGNCNEGLAYDFKKYGDKWKSVGLTVTRQMLY